MKHFFFKNVICIHPKTIFTAPFLTFVLLNLYFFTALNAQKQDLRFRHITQDDGLSQNIVNAIMQDSKGFMWFGTAEGLDKYDGYEFTRYVKGEDNGEFLSNDNVYSIFEDSKKNLWIGTENGGVNIFDRVLNKFTHLNLDSIPASVQNRNRIRSIIEDNLGNIWFIAGNAIVKIEQPSKVVKTYIPNSIQSQLNVLFLDSLNNIWFGTEGDGLGLFNIESKTFSYFTHNPRDKNSISDNYVISIRKDFDNNLWIGTYNGGLNLFDSEKRIFKTFIPKENNRESHTIKSILDDGEGNLWLGTRNGLYIFNKKTYQFKQFAHNMLNPNSITQDNVQVVFRDSKGDFWLGTKRGINFLNKGNIKFTHYRNNVYSGQYLYGSIVISIIEDRNNNIWFATENGGLNMLNRKTGIFKHYLHDSANPQSISDNNINTITEDKNGNLWIGAYQGGLNLFNPKTELFQNFIHDKTISPNFQNSIYSLFIGNDDILWIGTERGLTTFDMNKKVFVKKPLSNEVSTKITDCIVKGNGNDIWMGSRSSRVYRVNQSTLEYEYYQIPIDDQYIWIYALIFDDNDLWIGTKGYGLIHFNLEQNKYTVYTTSNGLANNNIVGLLKDNSGNIWISSLNGLSKFNPGTKKFINFLKENGLQSNEFSFGHLKTRSGELFFGDIDGAISFNPEEISENPNPIPIVFTDFKIFNKPVPIGGEDPILKSHISETKEILLSYDFSSFTITFAALALDMRNNINYAYKMEGFETEWNYVGKRRYATYTNLDPGNYTFKVKAAINDFEWVDKNTFINISISPPYWQTWWFRSFVISLIALILWLITNYIMQKRNLLKATALANHTQLKLLRNQMNPHFLLNAFSVIRALILVDRDKAWEMISKFSDFFRYMLFNYSSEKNTLNEEIDAAQNYISIQKVCFHENLDVSIQVDEGIQELIVPTFILQPLIENAIKYGIKKNEKLCKIRVNISYTKGILTIDTSNMGQLKYHDENTDKKYQTNGTSIKNIKQRLSIMFKEDSTFQLFEKDGWVHAIIHIKYDKYTNNNEESFLVGSDREKIGVDQ